MSVRSICGGEGERLIERRKHPPRGRVDSVQMLRALAMLIVAIYQFVPTLLIVKIEWSVTTINHQDQ